MSPEFVCRVLGWCTLLNLLLLVWWFVFYWAAHDWMYELHHRLFKLSVETFDAIHYAGMGILKIGIIFFNLGPYLVLRFLL